MDVFPGHDRLGRALVEPVVAIGNFDGVHAGHRRLLAMAGERALARGGELVVLTFDPHPARVLAPALAPPLLCRQARKLELLAAEGVRACVLEPFTPALAALSAGEFEERVLHQGLGAREVVVGFDFTYGRKRSGNVDTLRAHGHALGIAVHVVPPVTVDGLVASSTKVREFVLEGNVEGARVLLGRPFDVDGPVVRGAGRGKQIGIPTANVLAENELLPRPGVYAAELTVLGEGVARPAVANLGRNPTFVAAGGLSLEVHVLDHDEDLYDKRVRVGFLAWLRGEQRFASAEELVAQIRRDIAAARARLPGGA